MPSRLNDDLRNFIIEIPKVELHIHLEGCVTPEFWFQLNKKNEQLIEGPLPSIEALQSRFRFQNFQDFIAAFRDVIYSFHTPGDLYDLTCFVIENARQQNIRYLELLFTPWFLVKRGIDFHEMMAEIDRACKEGEEKYGVKVKLLFDGPRNMGPQVVMETFELATQERTGRVIGVGLGGDEVNYPAREFVKEFDFARAHGLRTVAHAGEGGGEKSMLDAIKKLKAERLGHCLGIPKSSKLERLVLEKEIPLELCPNSNVATGTIENLKDHPFETYLNRGYPISLHSDDPGFFQTNLLREYETMAELHKLKPEQLLELSRNAVRASFMSPSEKQTLLCEVNKTRKVSRVPQL